MHWTVLERHVEREAAHLIDATEPCAWHSDS